MVHVNGGFVNEHVICNDKTYGVKDSKKSVYVTIITYILPVQSEDY